MSETVEPLVLDLLEWIGREPRPYSEVLEAWRTSCPRLTVWEDAVDGGYVARANGQPPVGALTPAGRRLLADAGRSDGGRND